MTGALLLDDVSLRITQGTDVLHIEVPSLTGSRLVTFPDRAGEVSILGQTIDISNESNLSAGLNITLVNDTLNIDDVFVL